MQRWKTDVVCADKYRPRQFEYHPSQEDVVVFGTVKGEAVVVDLAKSHVRSSIPSGLSKDRHDSILGLCWLKRSPNRFVVGSSHGCLRLCDMGAKVPPSVTGVPAAPTAPAAEGDWKFQRRYGDLSNRWSLSEEISRNSPFRRPVAGGGAVHLGVAGVGPRIVTEFPRFERLTSVHVNSTDDHMLVSGYTSGVTLFDISTGKVVRKFEGIHEDHINISRFANHSPFVFATSSFDCTVKAWDSRMPTEKTPIYTCESEMGHVMLSFSPDDVFLLTSAVDNEVKQYLAVDGSLHMDLDLPRTGLDENFTRSYYTSSGRMILSGSSEEQMVRLYCAQTGRMIHEAEMYPGRKHGSLYVQSLRGDPHHDFRFSVLVNYRDPAYPLEIIKIDMLQDNDGEDLSSHMVSASSARLSSDLSRACCEKEGTDVYLVARNRLRFAAHKALVSCRCRVLATFIKEADAVAAGEDNDDDGGAGASDETAIVLKEQQQKPSLTIDDGLGDSCRGENQAMIEVCLPLAVAPEIFPVVLEYIYTDRLELVVANGDSGYAEVYCDPGTGDGTGKEHRQRGGSSWCHEPTAGDGQVVTRREWRRDTPSEVARYGKLLEAAKVLGLERLSSLVEWRCVRLVDTVRVVDVAKMALRFERQQLLQYCVHFLVSHLGTVYVLHGKACLPSELQKKVDEERVRRLYALNREADTAVMPTLAPRTPRSTAAVPATHQHETATGTDNNAGAGNNNNDAPGHNGGHGGNGLGAALAAAAAAVNAALGNVPGGTGAGAGEQVAGAAGGGAGAGASAQNGQHGHVHHDAMDEDDQAAYSGGEGFEDSEDSGDEDDGMGGEDEDNIVDEEVESTATSDEEDSAAEEGDEDEGPWMDPSQCVGGNLPWAVRRRLVPTATGHSGTAVLGSQMAVIGGANRRQVHSCRHVLMYDPTERTWSKMPTRGNAPLGLIHHSCTVLEPSWALQRNLLILGGPRHSVNVQRPKAPVAVLDCLTMEWSKPKVSGEFMADRTRHTAVAVCSDEDLPNRVLSNSNSRGGAGRCGGAPDGRSKPPPTEAAGASAASCGGKRNHFGTVETAGASDVRDYGGDTNVIVFGGFAPAQGAVFNDVAVLNVMRLPPGMSASAVAARRYHLSRRQRHSFTYAHSAGREGRGEQQGAADPECGSDSEDGDGSPSRRQDRESCLQDDECGGMRACTRSSHAYRYHWTWPMVLGTPPTPRLAHAATVVRVTNKEDGEGRGMRNQAYMVVFGGIGEGAVFNDVNVLRCSGLEWVTVHVHGRRPARRYGHAMVALSGASGSFENYAKLAVFGGTSGHNSFNDLFLLTVTPGAGASGIPRIKAEWEHLARNTVGILPSARSRQAMCLIKGELIIFGGSDETPTTQSTDPLNREGDSLVYHLRPRMIRMPLPRSQAGSAASSSVVQVAGSAAASAAVASGAAAPRRLAHERAMAREVATRMTLVQAVETRRTTAAAAAAAVAERMTTSLEVRASASVTGGLQQVEDGVSDGLARSGVVAGAARGAGETYGNHGHGGSAAGFAEFQRSIPAAASRRTHQPRLLRQKHPAEWSEAGPRAVQIVWESVRPQVFVYDAGPEPAVVVPPVALHRDMGSLVGSTRFSDVRFRFQAVDHALPTTPTSTAHYAIVSPPDLSPSRSSPSVHAHSAVAHRDSAPAAIRAGARRTRTSVAPSNLPKDSGSGGGHLKGSSWELLMAMSSSVDKRRRSLDGSSESSTSTSSSSSTSSGGWGAGDWTDFRSGWGGAADVNAGGASAKASGGVARGTFPVPSSLHHRRMDASGGSVVGEPDERARKSTPLSTVVPSSSYRLLELLASSAFRSAWGGGMGAGGDDAGRKRGMNQAHVDANTSARARAHSPPGAGLASTSPIIEGLRYPAVGFGRTASDMSSEGAKAGAKTLDAGRRPFGTLWNWRDVHSAGTAAAADDDDDNNTTAAEARVGRPTHQGSATTLVDARPSGPAAACATIARLGPSPSLLRSRLGSGPAAQSASASAPTSSSLSSTLTSNSYVGSSKRAFFDVPEAVAVEALAALAARDDHHLPEGFEGSAVGGVVSDAGGGEREPESVHAHRVVLALRSDLLKAMLGSGMRETFDAETLVKDVRPAVFFALLKYLYSDTLELERPQDIMELLVVANQYTLQDLSALCEGFLQGALDEENAAHLYHYADALAMPIFEHRVLTFILRNWNRVTRTEGWCTLPKELRMRANDFRIGGTHIFMLGQEDHVAWKGKRTMADWVYEQAWSDPNRSLEGLDQSWVSEGISNGKNLAHGLAEEGWTTAAESEGMEGKMSNDIEPEGFFSPFYRSPASEEEDLL